MQLIILKRFILRINILSERVQIILDGGNERQLVNILTKNRE
jgi:hypothetical protein